MRPRTSSGHRRDPREIPLAGTARRGSARGPVVLPGWHNQSAPGVPWGSEDYVGPNFAGRENGVPPYASTGRRSSKLDSADR